MNITSSRMAGGTKAGIILLFLVLTACLLTIVGLAIAVGVYRNKLRSCRKSEHYYRDLQLNNATTEALYCNCNGTTGTTVTPSTVSTCDSPLCSASAGEVISRMDFTADPCDNFYKYACGSYAKPENRPPDLAVLQTFDLPQQRVQQLLYQTLTASGNNYRGNPSTAVQKSKDYFSACVNDTVDDTTGRTALKQLLSYNPFDTANQTSWNIEDSLAIVHSLRIDGIVGLSIVPDPRNTSRYILALGPATLTLGDPTIYKKANMDVAYKNYVANILALLLETTVNYSDVSNMLWSFESAIANIYPSASEIAYPGNASNILKLSAIGSRTTPYLNLTALINKELQASRVTVGDDTDILMITPTYFVALMDVLQRLGPNTAQIISSYLGWTVYNAMLPYAGPSLKQAHDTFYAGVSGSASTSSPKWKTCLDETLNVAGFAAGAAYTDAQVNDLDKQRIDALLQYSKEDLISRLPRATWMTDAVRQRATTNANGLSWQIGFPKYLDNATALDQYYSDLNASGNHLQNVVAGRQFQVGKKILGYGKPVDTSEWIRNPTATYSYYNSATNQVLIQAGLLQKPMYDGSYPLAFTYGGIGSILGQKIMMLYGFQENWWDSITTANYKSRSQCFIDQYNKEKFYGIPVNGALTSVENIADTEGLKIAYDAYMKSVSNDPDKLDHVLPGLHLTGPQQFFLGFTQLGCSNFDTSRVAEVVQSNHVPSPIRVQLLLQNTPEFAQAFKCADGSNMKLADSVRCSLQQ